MRDPSKSRRGMTLIEMIVATVLSAILMVVLLGVSRRTMRLRGEAVRVAESLRDNELLVRQWRRDFLHGEAMLPLIDGVVIRGAIHRDPQTQTTTQQPAFVRYQVVGGNGRVWLLRHQWRIDPESGRPTDPQSEPVFMGLAAMTVSSDRVDAFDRASEAERLWDAEMSGATMPDMPTTIDIRLLDDQGNALVRHRIRHHWED